MEIKNTELLTIVAGASEKPDRYSYKAMYLLHTAGYPFVGWAQKPGGLWGNVFVTDFSTLPRHPHTLTLYLGPGNQAPLIEKILELQPKRIIFNPGTENPSLSERANKAGIHCVEACTLVLLSTGQYETA